MIQQPVNSVQVTCFGKNPEELHNDALRKAAEFFSAYYENGEIDQTALTVVMGPAEAEEEVTLDGTRRIVLWASVARVMFK